MTCHVRAIAVVANLALVGLLAACTSSSAADRVTTLPRAEESTTDTFDGALARGNRYFADRDQVAALERAVDAYQSAVRINPANDEVWTKLSRAAYVLADGHYSFDSDASDAALQRYLDTHERGIVYAKRALIANNATFQAKLEAGANMDDAVDVLDKSAVPALYWFAANYGKWAVAKGFATVLKYKDMIKRVMETITELDRGYFYGAADRYLGAYYAKTPTFAGGDMGKSKAYFEASIELAPNYFATKVLMAEYWARKQGERPLFERLLNEVLTTDANMLPDVAPENRIEQRKAKRLLAKADALF